MNHALLPTLLISLFLATGILLAANLSMFSAAYLIPLLPFLGNVRSVSENGMVDLGWYPPKATQINNLSTTINGTEVYGFTFNSSVTNGGYGAYNWCNMPHVRKEEYVVVGDGWELEYVEIIHRHQKRTPYASNTFPVESYPWYCSDEGLFYSGAPLNPPGNASSTTYWSVFTSPSNPFAPQGFDGTCQFPQITRGGLDDSHQHGLDLLGVYRDLLHFLPVTAPSAEVVFRVTNNVITSQVASMLVAAMYQPSTPFPLLVQPASIDSLEPTYSCPTASTLYATYGPGSSSPTWLTHLTAASPLFASLDAISGVSPSSTPFHISADHYFDNLSARLCHAKPLPCKLVPGSSGSPTNSTTCVTQAQADAVFRLGEYEYSFLYRSAGPWTLAAATASYGAWIAELASHLRASVAGTSPVKYRHNVAHDGSLARLLAVLQVEEMVWPGMGAEIVFELYGKEGRKAVRVLWGGRVLRSSSPSLGVLDMVPVERVLAYFDGLVGVQGAKVRGLCGV